MPVLLIGTLDTKGVEFHFVRDLLHQAGVATLVLDAGVLRPPVFPPDIPREEVYAAAGTSLAAVRQAGDRGRAVAAAATGATKIALDLHARGQVMVSFGPPETDLHINDPAFAAAAAGTLLELMAR